MNNLKMITLAVLINFVIFTPIVHFFGMKDGQTISLIDSIYYTGICSAIILGIFGWGGLCVLINRKNQNGAQNVGRF